MTVEDEDVEVEYMTGSIKRLASTPVEDTGPSGERSQSSSDNRITRVIQCLQQSHYHLRREIERRIISRCVHVECVCVEHILVIFLSLTASWMK
jgi:hypothetical protein